MDTSINDSITIFLLIYTIYVRFSVAGLLRKHTVIARRLTAIIQETHAELIKSKESTK